MVPIQVDHEMHPHKMGLANYIRALEEEKKKIQVFPRDLPLSLELVTQAIEKCIQHLSGPELNLNGQSECSARISTEEGLVFEDFIPIKQRASSSSSSSDCDEAEEHSSHKMKSDWLRSVQLWSSNPLPSKETVPRKTSVVEVKRNSGAFHPFYKEEITAEACKALITSPEDVPATSSTEPVAESSSKIEDKGQRKKRRCWSQELHKRFLHALQQLGGSHSATPKQIRELMKVDGLTNDEVKSHLQKFRLHTRRSPVIHNNAIANSPTAPLFLVGNIYEYVAAAVATTSTVSGELTTVTTPTGIYAPVATHPTLTTTTVIQPRFKKQHLCENSHSEERANHSEGVVVQSNSSATSYSTHNYNFTSLLIQDAAKNIHFSSHVLVQKSSPLML